MREFVYRLRHFSAGLGSESLRPLVVAIVLLAAGIAGAVDVTAGPYKLSVVTDPPVVPVGRAQLMVSVKDGSGQPVPDAQVKALAKMPGMSMGEREQVATAVPGQPGTYQAPAVFAMEGSYEVTVTVNGQQAVVEMSTGKPSTGGAGSSLPWLPVTIGLGAVALIAFVISRMRRSGQRVSLAGLASRQVIIPLVILAVAILLAVYAVRNWRRPGSMTPIEAQVMDMSAPAPEGESTVTLATASFATTAPTVTYTGQAVGYVEQDVVPRVTGTIVWMPFYVGDKVKRGQLLARLDTSQIDPDVAERSAGVSTAQQGVTVAASEYRTALSDVMAAQAEVGIAQGELQEAQANLDATKQGRESASADIASAQAEVQAAQADLQAQQAQNEYVQSDFKRQQQLINAGAISRDEFQKSKSEADKAAADVKSAEQAVAKAESGRRKAESDSRRVQAEIAAAARKVQQARASVRAKLAAVESARSAAEASKQKIGQAQSGVRQSLAGLKSVTTQRGYAELRAETDGVITQRTISPGQTVSPGQAILKVAQISPIRVQANVPESDLAKVQVGATVKVTHRGADETPTLAKVTSVSPSLDPAARTGTVEAVLPNATRRFLPGQFVAMEIAVGSRQTDVTVPAAAVQEDVTPGEEGKDVVWVANPLQGQSGRYTVTRTPVTLGGTAGDSVIVKSGLQPGQQVVVEGAGNLRAGQTVVSATNDTAVAENPTVKVTEAGFEPATIELAAGQPHRITFVRTTDKTCGTEVVFPELKIQKELPLNREVAVDLPAQQERELRFTCGMDMLKGKVVVR